VTYITALKGLALTIGAQNAAPKNIDEAAGRLMAANDAKDCIACHATNAVKNNV